MADFARPSDVPDSDQVAVVYQTDSGRFRVWIRGGQATDTLVDFDWVEVECTPQDGVSMKGGRASP